MTPNRTKSKQMLNLAVVAVAGACLASIPAFGQQQDRAGKDRAGQTQREDRIGQQADQQIDRSMLPKGITWSDEPADTGEVRGVIDDAVGAVVVDGGFNDLVERFVDQDRNRFGEWMNEGDNREFTQLNESAKRFQEAYNTKFNKEFDFDAESALAGIVAVQGEIEDAAIAAANWPVKPLGQQGGAEAGGEPRVAGEAMGEVQEETREQGNIEEGRQVAVVLKIGRASCRERV